MADQLWFMTRIREDEANGTQTNWTKTELPQTNCVDICARNTSMAFIITPWPRNLGKRYHLIDHAWLTILLVELSEAEYYHYLEMWVRCHSRSLKMVPFKSLHMASYLHSIVTMAVSSAISEIFSIKEWPHLKIWVWGRSRSLKMALFWSLEVTNI